ncbi:hypothetical protein BUALT_Bualt03G0101200 [Buddleja alternifolia]|uniref:25S rRNA (uridine-N(3))-methyltransferase BMT5-like domain-containing protein n=1 Tax=Buddleja alternifolia TaxID=168488 RepID=A0AAV6XZA3_9LAMI|nr:hypothetical protein BUALT_Bualt03G0101200 [Buddleja alternifolia]
MVKFIETFSYPYFPKGLIGGNLLSAFLKKNYKKFVSNNGELRSRGCKVMHGIDATTMATHALLGRLTFDRIVYNFPFAGFFNDLSLKAQIRPHRRLVSQFLKNAKEMISENGEIHISHKTNGRFYAWKLESLASSHRLRLIEAIDFNHLDYPGWNQHVLKPPLYTGKREDDDLDSLIESKLGEDDAVDDYTIPAEKLKEMVAPYCACTSCEGSREEGRICHAQAAYEIPVEITI